MNDRLQQYLQKAGATVPGRAFHGLPWIFALFLLLVLTAAGCATRGEESRPLPPPLLPAIVEDPFFVRDLNNMTPLGAAGIAVVLPSSGFGEEGKTRVQAMAAKLGVRMRATALERGEVPYTANSDEARLADLVAALTDPEISVIWAARGGYGASLLLEGLSRIPADRVQQKILIGYSDITFLHLFLQKRGWQTVHGAMFGELAAKSKDENNFRLLAQVVSGKTSMLRYDGLLPRNQAAKTLQAPIQAAITGGNLTCIAAATGTPWDIEAGGKILFLEDTDERGYKLDRMFTQLRNAGRLKGVRAVILGEFNKGDENTAYALERFARDCPVPVFSTELFGHGPRNFPLIFNAPAVLGEKGPGSETVTLTIRADQLPRPLR